MRIGFFQDLIGALHAGKGGFNGVHDDVGLDEEIDSALQGAEPGAMDNEVYEDELAFEAQQAEAMYDGDMPGDAQSFRYRVDPNIKHEVNEALRQWQEATTYFESVSDPDLVDFAIYDMEASRRKYMYLIKRTRGDMYNPGVIDVVDGA